MELQSWVLYHLVAVSDCNQLMQSAAATGGSMYPGQPVSTSTASAGTSGAVQSTGSRARDLGLRAQKKILGRFASSNAGRSLLIDEATTALLDTLYRLMERPARNSPTLDKKQPEKVLKNIVKLSIKIGLLDRNRQLGPNDAAKVDEIRSSLRSTAMIVVSFYELDFSFDRLHLTKALERCRSAVQSLVRSHLTDKSQDRCDQVFNFLTHPDFLDAVFKQDSELRPTLKLLVDDINRALENGQL